MKKVKSSRLVEELVAAATNLGGLQYRLRSIEEIIKGIDSRADDVTRSFTDREFVRDSLTLLRQSRSVSIKHARLVKQRIASARSQIAATTAKLERLSGRP